MGTDTPKPWDWVYHAPKSKFPYYMSRGEIKRKYYEVAMGRKRLEDADLRIMQLIGEYLSLYPNLWGPPGYPKGHLFVTVNDIRTAKFKREELSMTNPTQPVPPMALANPNRVIVPTADAIAQTEAKLADLKEGAKAEEKEARAAAQLALQQAEKDHELKERMARVSYELELATATTLLLYEVRSIELCRAPAIMRSAFAKFRIELAPLAKSYGYRIVLVGDKSVAVLTK